MKKILFFLIGAIIGIYIATYTIEIKSIQETDSGVMVNIKILYNDFEYYVEY